MAAARAGLVERTLAGFGEMLELADTAERVAEKRGWLQALDPRAKLAGSLLLIVAAVTANHLAVTSAILGGAIAVAVGARLPLRLLAARIWLPVLCFTGLIALPAIFTTPGRPFAWGMTAEGIRTALLLLVRAETSATLMALAVLTTPWTHLLKALRLLGVPVAAVALLGMTHRYIFLLLGIARDSFTAHHARAVARMAPAQERRLAAAAAGTLLGKSVQLAGDVFGAMQARGFRGEARTIHTFHFRGRDVFAAGATLIFAAAAVIVDSGLMS